MSRVVIDQALKSSLNGCNEQLEFCDETGEPLGHFVPTDLYQKLITVYAEAHCPYSAEDLARFRQERGGSTLAEVWERLGA